MPTSDIERKTQHRTFFGRYGCLSFGLTSEFGSVCRLPGVYVDLTPTSSRTKEHKVDIPLSGYVHHCANPVLPSSCERVKSESGSGVGIETNLPVQKLKKRSGSRRHKIPFQIPFPWVKLIVL